MKKDAYYFSHDANAQDDPKCMLLLDQLGPEGYGIYWLLIEKLRAEKDYKLPISVLPIFAKRWQTSKEKLETVVKGYDLFKIANNYFFSLRLKKSMEKKTELAKASASIRWSNANALQTNSNRNAKAMRNDAIKLNKTKEKENSISPFGGGNLGGTTGVPDGMVL